MEDGHRVVFPIEAHIREGTLKCHSAASLSQQMGVIMRPRLKHSAEAARAEVGAMPGRSAKRRLPGLLGSSRNSGTLIEGYQASKALSGGQLSGVNQMQMQSSSIRRARHPKSMELGLVWRIRHWRALWASRRWQSHARPRHSIAES